MIKTHLMHALVSAGLVLTVSMPIYAANLNGASDAGVVRPVAQTISRFDEQLNRIKPFLDQSDVTTRYQAHKAQDWLDYAHHQTFEGGNTAAYQQAWAESDRLVTALEQGQTLSLTTPIIASSSVMRRDLWGTAEILKKHPAFEQVAPQVAEAEVKLVWAAAEYCEMGWRHAREHFAAAERLLVSARAPADLMPDAPVWLTNVSYPSLTELNGGQSGCHGVVGPWPLVVPDFGQPVVEAPVAAEIADPVELVTAPNNVHFALDRHDLSAASQALLDGVAEILAKYPDANVTLYGHTDPRASVAYNQALSDRRANAVEQYLIDHGVDARRIATVAKGESRVIVDDDAIHGFALSRRVEIVYSNAGLEIIPKAQTTDLQPER